MTLKVFALRVILLYYKSMKKCGGCGEIKPPLDFGRNKARRDGLQSQCKECRKGSNAVYYKNTPERNAQRIAWLDGARETARNFVLEYLIENPCPCGEGDPVVLEFDHLGDKTANISDMVMRGTNPERLRDEMSKCQVLCANCHRRVTAERAGYWRFGNAA